ncbi:hypothetical protein [Nitrospira sp. Nam80]
MNLRIVVMAPLVIFLTSCTTKIGTNIATDRIIAPTDHVEVLGAVAASATRGGLLWAKPADRQLYEEVRRQALNLRDGTLLINAKITTVLTSYLGLYYRTMVHIDGMAARVVRAQIDGDSKRGLDPH